jgi:hypothetical protein
VEGLEIPYLLFGGNPYVTIVAIDFQWFPLSDELYVQFSLSSFNKGVVTISLTFS